jgi:2-dehydro-3-deoxyphosphooctonate aldolase (KDO 8-P synthase)
VQPVQAGSVALGAGAPLALIAGPCVIESEAHALFVAEAIAAIAARCSLPYIFKASYDKANRTSGSAFRGPGLEEGLRVLAAIKRRVGMPILTDVHDAAQAGRAAEVADVITAAARTGRAINIKKGQFLAPDDVGYAVEKVKSAGNSNVFVTERGFSFGYHNLVVDMRAFPMMRTLGFPVVFDVTHSLQLPGAGQGETAGQAEFIEPLASAGVAAGVDGIFLEVHEEPRRARSDAQNALPLDLLEPLLRKLIAIDHVRREHEVQPKADAAAEVRP